jgi:hypothetical protein
MCASGIYPFPNVEKACSGKCRGECVTASPRLWVIAACNGMVSLFQKVDDHLEVVAYDTGTVFPSLESLSSMLKSSAEQNKFQQLMVVGSSHDMAWLHMSLPEEASSRIVAEVQYPLLPAWFPNAEALSHALKQVVIP